MSDTGLSLTKPEGKTMGAVVDGVGADAPTVVNAAGGKQSDSPYRADLLPPLALLAVAKVLKHGADKYGANNWHAIPVADHVNHALVHLLAAGAGDTSDEHLEHAACRILFALDSHIAGRDGKKAEPAGELLSSGFRVGDRVRAGGRTVGTVTGEVWDMGIMFVNVLSDQTGSVGGWLPSNVQKIGGAS